MIEKVVRVNMTGCCCGAASFNRSQPLAITDDFGTQSYMLIAKYILNS